MRSGKSLEHEPGTKNALHELNVVRRLSIEKGVPTGQALLQPGPIVHVHCTSAHRRASPVASRPSTRRVFA